jgi:hypothetical protein
MLQGEYMNGYYRDPYLHALINESDAAASVVGGDKDGPWFVGPASKERWMELKNSGLRLRCVPSGFELKPSPVEEHQLTIEALIAARDDVEAAGDRFLLAIPQVDLDEERVDIVDRIQVGADLLRALVDAGC